MTKQALDHDFRSAAPVVPKGVAHLPHEGAVRTRSFAFLTLPNFTLLAFSALIDPLRIANQLTQCPLYSWKVVSLDGAPTRSSAGIEIVADAGLDRLPRKTTVVVCSGTEATRATDRRVLNWLRDHARFGGQIGAICTAPIRWPRPGFSARKPRSCIGKTRRPSRNCSRKSR